MKEPMEKGGPVADQPLPQPYSDAEIADVIAQVRDAGSYASSPESREHYERLAATLAELDGLRKDKERLDWLNGRGSEFEGMTAATPPRETVWFFKSAKHSDIRTAIDAVLASRSLPGALKEEKE